MNPTPAYGRREWLEDLILDWLVRLVMIGVWLWATAGSVRHRLQRLRWRLAVKGEQP